MTMSFSRLAISRLRGTGCRISSLSAAAVISSTNRISHFSTSSTLGLSTEASSVPKREELFFRDDVQARLRHLTGMNYDKIFKVKSKALNQIVDLFMLIVCVVFQVAKEGQEIIAPTYKYVTDKELAKMNAEIKVKAQKKLQMPPVMDEREPINR